MSLFLFAWELESPSETWHYRQCLSRLQGRTEPYKTERGKKPFMLLGDQKSRGMKDLTQSGETISLDQNSFSQNNRTAGIHPDCTGHLEICGHSIPKLKKQHVTVLRLNLGLPQCVSERFLLRDFI